MAVSRLRAQGGAASGTARRVSFSLTLATTMGLLVLLAVAAVIAIQLSAARQNTLSLLNRMAELALERIEAGIRDHLEPAVAQTEYVAKLIEAGDYDLVDRDRLATLLEGALAGTPQVAAIAVWDPELQQLAALRSPDGRTRLVSSDQSANPEIMAATRAADDTEGAFWGDLVRSEDGNTLINLRRALRRSGSVVGYMATVIAVPELSELVTDIGDLFDTTAFILYGRDRVLAHPFLISAPPAGAGAEPAVPLDRLGDLILASIWEGVPLHGFEAAAEDRVEVVEITLGDQAYAAVYRWIDDYGEVPWVIGAWTTKEDVYAEISRLRHAAIAGIAVLVLAIVLAVVLGRLISRPIKRAASGAALIGELDLEHVDSLPASAILELDDQSRAFNTMLASLRSFETYVPRALVTRLIHQGGDEAVASVERELTVMFTDIAGFTAMAEGKPAAEIADFLNRHFALLGRCAEAEGGTVDKFIGDALMAFWGAPEVQVDHAARAVRAARAMALSIEADNQGRAEAGLPPVRVRIGIHSGPVVVGNVGWPGRINYTIVGDTVNSCQRIEALGKQMDRGEAVTVLLSEATARLLNEPERVEDAGRFMVEGKTEEIGLYRLRVG